MEDRSTLLKVYNDRTTILDMETMSLKEFMQYLDQRALRISKHLLSSIAYYSSISGSIRSELLIEGILQYLKGKRDYNKESLLLNSMHQEKDSWTYEEFKTLFSSYFSLIYEPNELLRVTQIVKRFGINHLDLVPYEYLERFIMTSQLQNFDKLRNCKMLTSAVSQLVNRIFFSALSNIEDKKYRKPLEIISNVSLSVTRPKHRRDNSKSESLRSRLFFQAFKSFSSLFTRKVKLEVFFIIKNPYKTRNPYIHRGVYKIFLRFQNKACEALSNAIMKWSMPQNFFECVKDMSLTSGITKENTTGFSRHYSFLALTHEHHEKGMKISAMILRSVLDSLINKARVFYLKSFILPVKAKLYSMVRHINFNHASAKRKTLNFLNFYIKILRFQQDQSKKQDYVIKRQKYTLCNKGKKIAARSIYKVLVHRIFRKYIHRFKTNTRFPKRNLNKNLGRTVEIELPKRPQGLSRSFISQASPKISTKYEDMKSSLRKIKITNGIEGLWKIMIKLQKKNNEFPIFRAFGIWKTIKFLGNFSLNIKKIKSAKYHHSSQFSFRDKV